MASRRRHLLAAIGLGLLALLLLGLLIWALQSGVVIERWSSDSSRQVHHDLYTRDDDPGHYWLIVGLLAFWALLLGVVALAEFASYRALRGLPETAPTAPPPPPQPLRRQAGRAKEQAQADALEPLLNAVMDAALPPLRERLGLADIGWLLIPDPVRPHRRAVYLVLPAGAALDRLAAEAPGLQQAVRDALRGQGYPQAWLEQLSVQVSSAEWLRDRFGNAVPNAPKRP